MVKCYSRVTVARWHMKWKYRSPACVLGSCCSSQILFILDKTFRLPNEPEMQWKTSRASLSIKTRWKGEESLPTPLFQPLRFINHRLEMKCRICSDPRPCCLTLYGSECVDGVSEAPCNSHRHPSSWIPFTTIKGDAWLSSGNWEHRMRNELMQLNLNCETFMRWIWEAAHLYFLFTWRWTSHLQNVSLVLCREEQAKRVKEMIELQCIAQFTQSIWFYGAILK